VYVEPDPWTEAGVVADGEAPGLVRTIIGGYAGIPRQEPILIDLTDLAVHNTNVQRIRDVIETNFDPVRNDVLTFIDADGATDAPSTPDVTRWRRALAADAAARAGYAYPTYLRLRRRAVIDDFARLIITRQQYPPTSGRALFVQRVLATWATHQEAGLPADDRPTWRQGLIEMLDLSRLERHARFLIAAMSWWYRPNDDDGRRGAPDRPRLDEAKATLYGHLDQLNGLALLLVQDDDVRSRVDALFAKAALPSDVLADPDAFVAARGDDLLALQQMVQERVGRTWRS
jgi:hypothetical protein